MSPFDTATLPLSGLRLIEASAGTGKTFSLAGLYLRLIIEKRASVRDILVMTFTKAATQELRKRIHERLERAAIIAQNRDMARQDSPEDRLTCLVLDRMNEANDALARRLRDAAERVDEATIVTIHGFARRAVEENAFDSALAFDRGDPVDASEIFRQATADYWRREVFGQDGIGLQALWPTPDKLYKAIRVILEKPHARLSGADKKRTEGLVWQLSHQFSKSHEEIRDGLVNAWDSDALLKSESLYKALNKNSDPVRSITELFAHIEQALHDQKTPLLPDWFALLGSAEKQFKKADKYKMQAEWFSSHDVVNQLAELQKPAKLTTIEKAAAAISQLAQTRKVQQRQYSYDDLIVSLHKALQDKPTGPRLAAVLFERWPYALVDEFQDTDPLQYASLRTIYQPRVGEQGALLLIGDPKQAIYGFRGGDIYAYLEASHEATACYTQTTNYRSTAAVLRAIETLYQHHPDAPFVVPEIDFPHVGANPDADRPELIRADGTPWPALTVWQLHGSLQTDNEGRPKKPNKADDEARLIDETVSALGELLHTKPACWRKSDGSTQPVQPSDIAILVNKNAEATKLQTALAHKGIRAVCQHRTSVYTSPEAGELVLILQAMVQPGDAASVRAAHTTRLLGKRLADLIKLADDDHAMQATTDYFQALHDHWQRHGVLSALNKLFAAAASNILARVDGERRMSNYLQLGELLADGETACFGMTSLVHWLSRRMVEAGENRLGSEDQSELRLESDAQLIRISTIHGAKGLEYPIVFMPFALELGTWTSASISNPEKPPLIFHTQTNGSNEALIDLTGEDETHVRQSTTETRSENLRLLYVALTRAKQAIVIGWRDPDAKGSNGALADLLYRDGIEAWGQFDRLAEQHPDLFHVRPVDVTQPVTASPHFRPMDESALDHARCDLPGQRPYWASYSFSRLAHAAVDAQADDLVEYAATDEAILHADHAVFDTDSSVVPELDDRLGGTRFGSAVHDILETQLKQDSDPWPRPGESPTDGQREQVYHKLRQYGLLEEDSHDPRVDDTVQLVARTLHTPLPGMGALADIPRARLLTEMEFLLRLGGNRLGTLVATLREHGYLQAPLGGHPAQVLFGLMQGFIDLIVEADGQYHVIDYKTNNLGDTMAAYDETGLKNAIGRAHYDLQYLLYNVALHRHLKYCFGSDYNPAQHLGTVHYLFVRAMDGATPVGIYSDQPDTRLIEQLDQLFDASSQR